jgi:hypothetical protein
MIQAASNETECARAQFEKKLLESEVKHRDLKYKELLNRFRICAARLGSALKLLEHVSPQTKWDLGQLEIDGDWTSAEVLGEDGRLASTAAKVCTRDYENDAAW